YGVTFFPPPPGGGGPGWGGNIPDEAGWIPLTLTLPHQGEGTGQCNQRVIMAKQTDPITLWRNIIQAGGAQAFIQQQLRERGYLVERRETDGMSEHELTQYKKQLRAEAEELRKIKKETWLAYKANHIVHLGEGIYWNDEPNRKDRWDTPHAEE